MSRALRTAGLSLVLFALSGGGALALASDFEHPASHDTSQQFLPGSVQRQDTPNDPSYDQAEPDSAHKDSSATNLYDESFDLFGFPSFYTTGSAKYLDPAGPNVGMPQVSGYNAAGAWKLTRGRADVVIAILDTGVKWDRSGLRDQIHLNTGELPLPQDKNGQTHPSAGHGGFDLNANGVVDVDDFANDPRVPHTTGPKQGGVTLITAKDLIDRFGHCRIANHQLDTCPAGGKFDNDGNGYANDIAGWNFFDDNNDPTDLSSYFAAGNHGSGRAGDAVERGNDGDGGIGVCPHCQFVPVRIWDTFVADGNSFMLGAVYATDNGAKVIEGADGSLYHSAFTERASQYVYDHGAVQTYSGDDLNTGDHNLPANYGHAMLIEGTVPDSDGLGMDCSGAAPICSIPKNAGVPLGTQVPATSYFRGANTTQYGGKSSISMEGATGSINTGRASGGAGLVVSSALDHGIALRPDETREILEQTAEDVTQGNTGGIGTPDPAGPGWDSHFGWGRANLGAAVSVAASASKIPDEAAINSPDWYAPVTGSSLTITGRADARWTASHRLHYLLEWGPGLAPTTWHPVKQADATGPITNFGSINLAQVRSEMASYNVPPDPGGPVFSPSSRNPYKDQFAVRLTVTDPTNGNRLQGIDRRVFTAVPDGQGLRPGYPKRMGTGGEAQPRYADLNGDNVPELIVPTEDGTIHAYEPDGSELPGWPVHTIEQWNAVDHHQAPGVSSLIHGGGTPLEPPRGPAVADIDGDGRPEVITTAGTDLYVWEPDGTLRAGFPVSSNFAFCGPSHERQDDMHPKCGFSASPAVAKHLEGPSGPTDIVVTSLDGHLYAFRPNGQPVPHFPRPLVDPNPPGGHPVVAESINEPGIVDLNGDGYDDVVAATNETYGASMSNDVSFTGLASNAKGASTRVYAINGRTGAIMPGWPIKISGLIEDILPFVGPGNDPSVVNVGGAPKVVASATSGSLATYNADGSLAQNMHQESAGAGSDAVDKSPGLNLFEGSAIGKLVAGGSPAVVKYELSTADAANLLLVSQNFPYNHLIGAWDAATGAPAPSYPRITDDFQFLSSSTIAKVDPGSPASQVLAGTGLGLLHAYDGATGLDASGFPKVTGGWLFAPAALSTDGRLADITREGYLFEWGAPGIAPCQSEWPTFRHDPQNTGNYDRDGTAPAAPGDVSLASLGGNRYRLRFKSPGDDGFCGQAARFRTQVDGQTRDLHVSSTPMPNGGTTVSRDITLPSGAGILSVQAIDEAGNVGEPADLILVNPPSGGGGTSGGGKGTACHGIVPRSSISVKHLTAKQKLLAFSGHSIEFDCAKGKQAAGRVKRVLVSVGLVAHGKCRFLGGNGRLGKARKCSKAVFLAAKVKKGPGKLTSWTFKKKVSLPLGRYVVAVRGVDPKGRRELIPRTTNNASFTLYAHGKTKVPHRRPH